jgi:hypothetical protein
MSKIDLPEIKRLLIKAQWAAHDARDAAESNYCFECGGYKPDHEPGCKLAAAIAALAETGEHR